MSREGETEEDVVATVRLVNAIHPTTGWANTFAPLPGSPIYRELKDAGRIAVHSIEDWVNYSRTGWGNTNQGPYAQMPAEKFESYRTILQSRFQAITQQGLKRKLEFSA